MQTDTDTDQADQAPEMPPPRVETEEAETDEAEPERDTADLNLRVGGERLPPVKPKQPRPEKKANGYVPVSQREDSAVRRAVRESENKSLRELIESFGTEGAYLIELSRKEPPEFFDRASGRTVITGGFLRKLENKAIDEEYIAQHFGGGTYDLKFKERKPSGTGWQYAGHKVVTIAGDPLLTTLPGQSVAPPQQQAQQQAESPSIVKEAMSFMADAAKRAEQRAEQRGQRGDHDPVVDLLRDQIRSQERVIDELRREMRDAANRQSSKPPEDAYKDKLLDKMIDGDSARLTAVRTQYESELRMAKDHALSNENRLRDQFERERQDLRNAHEREIALLRQAHETALAAAKSAFDTQMSAAKSSFDTQTKLLEAENKRIDKENTELRVEVKDLRAKKDKSILEMAKELKTVKEAFEDEAEDTSIGAKLAEAAMSPETWQGISSLVRGPAPAAPQQPQPQQLAPKPKRSVIRGADGKKYILEADGKTMTGPLPEKARRGEPAKEEAQLAEPQMPQVDPTVLGQMVTFLESAFTGGQDAEVVAQGARSRVPEALLVAIRDHGVDAVMSKMAKLSSTSPLSTQAGRNWVRKLGKALVGE